MNTGYYINLERSHNRRAALESCFGPLVSPAFSLQRIPATAAAEVGGRYPGTLTDVQKACILSHAKALQASLEHRGRALILEDDASLGSTGLTALRSLLEPQQEDKDLIFLNALVTNKDFVFGKQYELYRRAIASGNVFLLDMREMTTAGADAYIVTHQAKSKLLALLGQIDRYDTPYDLLLAEWIHSGKLKASLAFPFVTSLSTFADVSLVSGSNPDWNHFRRLFSLDSQFGIAVQTSRGTAPEVAVEAFTDEYLKFIKMLLIRQN